VVEKTKFLARVGWETVLPFYALLPINQKIIDNHFKIIDMENGILLQITYLITVLLFLALSFAESMINDTEH